MMGLLTLFAFAVMSFVVALIEDKVMGVRK